MKNTQALRIHFILLVIGTAFYLYMYPGMVTIGNGVPEANIIDIEFFFRNTMFYLAFIVLVFGHGLLWRLPSEHPGLSDDEKERIEEIKSRLNENNKLK
jgi:hypothetical protein